MTPRLTPAAAHLALIKPLIDFANSAQEGLDPTLAELVKIRASQINGCAFCLFMHTRDARKRGETEERIYLLEGWRESPLYTERERAALAWTEALTQLREDGVSDQIYDTLKKYFSEEEQIKLTLVIGAINAFNRINVGFRVPHTAVADRRAA
jgi:AhpD family alkylhydroperoxidase